MTTTLSAISARLHVYEIRPRKDKRGFGLISDVLPFDGLWYGEPNAVTNATGYAMLGSSGRKGHFPGGQPNCG